MDAVSPLRLYDTLAKRERDFSLLEDNVVRMYTCGPTVYGRPHVGNYSSFLMADLLRRWLEAGHRYHVVQVKNITDVGHLVADRDEGEDKVEKEARKEKKDPLAVARMYEEQYLEDEDALNMLPPAHRPRATETVPEMLAMVKDLLAKGIAYETEDGIYFDVAADKHYGCLSGNTIENLSAGARIDVDEKKKHPADFALWKKCVGNNARHLLRWSFATGERVRTEGDDASAGFPGWHIECSAMSRKYLGDTLDIHTGGEDNIFPHHEAEIAQSEAVTGKQFVRFWLHKRRIDLAGEKMSKSLGNILTVPDVIAKGFSPLDLRYYLLSVHYRTNLKFSWKGMEDARKARRSIVEWMNDVMVPLHQAPAFASELRTGRQGDTCVMVSPSNHADVSGTPIDTFSKRFADAMNDDLNTPAALAAVFDCMNWSRSQASLSAGEREALAEFAALARATFGCFEPEEEIIPADILTLARERDAARAKKDFAASDRIRDALLAKGYEVRDTTEGTKVKKR